MSFCTVRAWVIGSGLVSGLGMAVSAVFRIGGAIASMIIGGFKTALSILGQIGKGLLHLPITGLKFLAAGGAAVYGAHKALGPAAEMERYKVQLDVMKKGNLYDFLTKASAGKPFQMGETVQAGVLMEAFKIPAKQFLGTVMDAAAGFKKPLEEVVRMLGYARSGRTGEALESSARIGITRSDLRKFGIRFEKSGQATADTADKLMTAMIALMKSRFGGMANRIGTTTYQGAVSDFKDSLFRAFAGAGEKFLPYATKIVRSISSVATEIGNKLKTLPWAEWGQKLAGGIKAAGNVIKNLMNPTRRGEIGGSLEKAWSEIKPLLPKLGTAIKLDLLDTIKIIKPKIVDMIVAAGKLAIDKIKQLINPPPKINKDNPVIAGASQKITRREIAINAIRRERVKNGTDKDIFGRLRPITTKEWQDWLENRSKKNWRDVEKQREQGRFDRAQKDFKTDMGTLSKSEQSRFDKAKTVEELKELRKQITAERAPKKPLAPRTMETAKEIVGKVKTVIKTATQTPEKEKIPLSLIKAGRDTGYVNGKAVELTAKELKRNAEVMKKIAEKPDKYRLADPKGDAIKKREAEAEKRRQAREKVNENVEALLNPKSPAELLKQVIPEIFGRSQPKVERDVFGREIKEVTTEIKNGNSDQVDLLKRLERQLILLNKKLTDGTP